MYVYTCVSAVCVVCIRMYYVCMYICIYIYMYIYVCIYVCAYIYKCYLHIKICARKICARVYVYIWRERILSLRQMSKRMSAGHFVRICMRHVCIYIHMYCVCMYFC